MTLATIQKYTDAKTHPYLHEAKAFLLEGAVTYYVLKRCPWQNPLYAATLVAVSVRVQATVCSKIEQYLPSFTSPEASALKEERPDITPCKEAADQSFTWSLHSTEKFLASLAVNYVFSKTISAPFLARVGVQAFSWKIAIAIAIIQIILSLMVLIANAYHKIAYQINRSQALQVTPYESNTKELAIVDFSDFDAKITAKTFDSEH